MPRAFIHIGMPKTGTSAFQLFLRDHADWLSEQGIRVIRSGQSAVTGAHHHLARAICGLPTTPDEFGLAESAGRELRSIGDSNVLMSSEGLSATLKAPEFRSRLLRFIRSCGFQPVIIMYVGDRFHNANTRYAQGTKSLSQVYSFVDFVRGNGVRHSLPHWRTFHAQPGVEFILRPYTESVRQHGIVADMLEAIGIKESPPVPDGRANVSPGPIAVGLNRWMGRYVYDRRIALNAAQRNQLSRRLLDEVGPMHPDTEPYCGITPELAAIIETDTRPFLDDLAITVWGKHWGDLFPRTSEKNWMSNDIEAPGTPRPSVDVWRDMQQRAIGLMEAIRDEPRLAHMSGGVDALSDALETTGVSIRRLNAEYLARHMPEGGR